MTNLVELIARKRDGAELSSDQIHAIVQAHQQGAFTDYQMSALCMAIYFQGMSARETAALTEAMLHSGTVIDLSHVAATKVDKHSTGGVGDKVSLCLAPLVAACGVAVPMISGRGLGHTGGTLDKLEAISGFDVNQDTASFMRIVERQGVCMAGQTAELAPADKRIYALRDVTGTVEAIPLIVASILSKKLAEGIDALVLDVKVGRGAFMKTEAQARQLAEALVRVGTTAGKRVSALLTDMSAPLGRTIGNAIETREAIEILRGGGPDDLLACTLALGAEMLVLGQVATDPADGEKQLRTAIDSGRGAEVFERMIAAQGGDPSVVGDPSRLPHTAEQVELCAEQSGVVSQIDALEVGLTSVAMGAGRSKAEDPVDHAVGIELLCQLGDEVAAGQSLAKLHVHQRADAAQPAARLARAIAISEQAPARGPLIIDRIEA